MSALRLARAATRRDRVIKFAGCYHGHVDALLASAGSGMMTLGIPSTPGVPAGVAADTIVCEFNDVDGVAAAVARYGEGLAAILVEPVAGNMGVVPPAPGFLEALRALCDATGALLVFDEVITGFRVARGGAQERYGVTARPHDPREDRRRRASARGVRRSRRADGAARARRRRLPGGHAVAATRSPRPPASRCCAGYATAASTRSSSASAPGSRKASRRSARVQRVGAMLTLFCRRRARARATPMRRPATPSASARSSAISSHRGVYLAPVAVRVPVPVPRALGRGRRPDGRGGPGLQLPFVTGRPTELMRSARSRPPSMTSQLVRLPSMRSAVADDLFHAIAEGATRESPLWAAALLPPARRERRARVLDARRRRQVRARGRDDLRGVPPALRPPPALRAAGRRRQRCCSATPCSRTGSSGSPRPGRSQPSATSPSCSRSAPRPGPTGSTATAPPGPRRRLCSARGGLDEARASLRDRRDAGPLERLARRAAGDGRVDEALAAHVARLV